MVFDHIGFNVTDFPKTKEFLVKALQPLGIGITMEGDGWVSATAVVQQGRPDKKVYTVSPAGRAELARWIADPADRELRDIAVKLRGAGPDDVAALRDQLVSVRVQGVKTVSDLDRQPVRPQIRLRRLALERGIVQAPGPIRGEQPPHGPVAQAAGAIIEQDRPGWVLAHSSVPRRMTNAMLK